VEVPVLLVMAVLDQEREVQAVAVAVVWELEPVRVPGADQVPDWAAAVVMALAPRRRVIIHQVVVPLPR
jgi:hypothetical protein